jgi:hypothetical protein
MRATVFVLIVGAVATELAKPPEERTWHGKVLDLVPYDFRPPTWERIRDAYWNPESDRLFSDRVFGVGWAINLYRAKALMEEAYERLMGGRPSLSIEMTTPSERVRSKPGVVRTRE